MYLPFHILLLSDICFRMFLPLSTKFVINSSPQWEYNALSSTILNYTFNMNRILNCLGKALKQVKLSAYTSLLKVVNFLKYESNPSNWISANVFLPLKYLSAMDWLHNYFWSISTTSIFSASTDDKKVGKESIMMYCLPVKIAYVKFIVTFQQHLFIILQWSVIVIIFLGVITSTNPLFTSIKLVNSLLGTAFFCHDEHPNHWRGSNPQHSIENCFTLPCRLKTLTLTFSLASPKIK